MIDSNPSKRARRGRAPGRFRLTGRGPAIRYAVAPRGARMLAAMLIAIASLAMAGCATGGAGEGGYVAQSGGSASNSLAQNGAPPASVAKARRQVAGSKVVGVWEGES